MSSVRRVAMLSAVLIGAPWVVCAQVDATPMSATGATSPGIAREQSGQMKVVCSGDQLTITANGNSLSTILSEVSRCSGAKIDGAEAAARTKLFETIGPAPIQEVLTSLLDATGINYVIQVSDSNPRKVATVMLLARTERGSGSPAEDTSGLSGRRALLKQMQEPSRLEEEAASEDGSPVAEAAGDGARAADGLDAGPGPTPPPTSSARVPTAAANSTPASSQMSLQDRIAEMQRMFEQRKQMLQDQNSHPH